MKLNNPPQIHGNQAKVQLDRLDLASYTDLISLRTLPVYDVRGDTVHFPASYLENFYQEHITLPLPVTDRLFDYQQVMVRVGFIKERYAIFADAGLGKCHGKDTPILMYDGSIKMVQDIQPGDKLMGPDSKPRNVLSTNQGYGDLYRVVPTKGEPFVCNDVHVLSLRCTGTKSESNQYKKNEIINIPLNEYLDKGPLFKSYMKLWRTGVEFQEEKHLELEPYMLGLWLGNGTIINGSLTLNDNDTEVIDYFLGWANKHNFNVNPRAGRSCTTWLINNHGKHNSWFKLFIQTLVVKGEKRIPQEYLTASCQNRLELLAGLIDTDGYSTGNTFEIVTKYPGLAQDILFLARSLGFGTNYRVVTKGIKSLNFIGTYYKITIFGDTNLVPLKLERKQAAPRRQKKNVLNTGFKVEYIGKGDYYGFAIDGDHLYLLGDFTVTHNTYVLGELARQIHAATTGKIILCIPLNILHQFEEMVQEFWPDFPPFDHLHGGKLTVEEWCVLGTNRIAFVNHEAFIKPQKLRNVDAFLLDEASILKGGQGGNGKIAQNIVKSVSSVRFRYAASATPAPNDRTEYAMLALFLGLVRSEKEFYSMYFINKDGKYVLRRHATEAFYRYLAFWSIFIRNPAAYGFENNLKDLLPWKEIYVPVETTPEQELAIQDYAKKGVQQMLPGVVANATGMTQRIKFSQISKGFVYRDDGKRVELIRSNKPDAICNTIQEKHLHEQVILWTVFDEEGEILLRKLKAMGRKSVHITGATKETERVRLIDMFRHGEIDDIISKPRILGFGLNFQFCRVGMYSGLDDSYEKYYQSAKRLHRYGQIEQVLLYHFYTPYEEAILQNVLGKQQEMVKDFEYQEKLYIKSLADELKQFLLLERAPDMEEQEIHYEPAKTADYQIYHGDSIKTMLEVKEGKRFGWLGPNTVDLSVFSPPFMGDVFTYTKDPADMSNTRGAGAEGGLDEFMMQFRFFLEGMKVVTKPGRLMAMHLEDVPLRKGLDGYIGIFDFVGEAIRQANKAGWILVGKIPILKNQQAQSIVKKIGSLTMSNMELDRLRIAPCSNGYLCLFKKPGEANIRIADLAKCEKCGWNGYSNELLGWSPRRGYKSAYLMEVLGQCPKCRSEKIVSYSEMDGNKWILLAEGIWPEDGFNENYDKLSKISQEQRWIDLVYTALGIWPDIRETDVMRSQFTSDQNDEDKHLCPLPRSVARRAIELYSLPGELVFTPFAGIGTEVDAAIRLGRRAAGIELKSEYFTQAVSNAELAVKEGKQMTLFDLKALERGK